MSFIAAMFPLLKDAFSAFAAPLVHRHTTVASFRPMIDPRYSMCNMYCTTIDAIYICIYRDKDGRYLAKNPGLSALMETEPDEVEEGLDTPEVKKDQ